MVNDYTALHAAWWLQIKDMSSFELAKYTLKGLLISYGLSILGI